MRTVLPGEKVELELRPSPASWLPRYLAALGFAAWGGLLLLMFDAWWEPDSDHPIFDAISAHLLALSGLCAVGAAWTFLAKRWLPLFLLALVGIAASAAAVFLGGSYHYTLTLPVAVALASAPALAWTEATRLGHRYRVTNLRLAGHSGIGKPEWSVRYTEIADLDARQDPLGRAFGHGTLLPVVPEQPPVALLGIHPFQGVRRLVEALVQDATATPYLREAARLDDKVSSALLALQRGKP